MHSIDGTASGGNVRTTIRHISATLCRQWIATLLQFAFILLVARSLGKDALGNYTIAILIPTLLSQFLNFGLAGANVYFIASGRATADDAWSASRWCVFAISLLGTIAGICLIGVLGDNIFPGVPRTVLLLSLLLFPFMLTTSIVLSFFQALRDFRAFNGTLFIQPSMAVVGATALTLANRVSLESILAVVFMSHALAMAYALVLLSRHVVLTRPGSSPFEHLRAALRFGGMTHAGNVLALLTYRLDILLVNYFAGQALAGLYAVALRLAENLGAVSQASSTVLFPTFAAMASQRTAQRQVTRIMACGVMLITLLTSTVVAIIARPLVAFLFGEAFTSAVPAFLILLPGVVALSGARVLANDSAARGKPGLNLLLAGFGLVVNMLANSVLIPRYGISGAAMGSTLAYSLDLVIRVSLLWMAELRTVHATGK